MEKCPSETNSHLAGQEITSILWKPKVQYCVYESLRLILSSYIETAHIISFVRTYTHISSQHKQPECQAYSMIAVSLQQL
jgi:hypothetical protein